MFVLFFLVHGDVAVEIFKRALLPSFWFILFQAMKTSFSRFIHLAGVV